MCSPNPWKVSSSNLAINVICLLSILGSPGDVVIVKVESDQLMERPQRGGGNKVQLVVSDGEELKVSLQTSEGLAVNVTYLVVVQRQRGQPWQTLKVPSADLCQEIVVHGESVQLVQSFVAEF